MAGLALLALTLLPLTGAHPDSLRSSSRRLVFSSDLMHIWGACDRMDRYMSRCDMPGNTTCSDRLSDGPDDADVEIRLGNLTPSRPGSAVHLQWWAPRRSPTTYDPLKGPVNCSVYSDLRKAYPKYHEGSFNGGNVRVSEAGEAVIRVRAPATYYVWQYIAVPHVHLRLCHGEASVQNIENSVIFDLNETWVARGKSAEHIEILSAQPYVQRSGGESTVAPKPEAVIVGVLRGERGTTTLAPEAVTTTTLDEAAEHRAVLIDSAKEALDLDALEFSPVYLCLMEEQFFDHFSSNCAESCPEGSAVSHGQCVREETADEPAELETMWKLEIACSEPCWHDKKHVSLHKLRLSLAGHLDIPFQEVEVTMGFADSTDRRLLDTRVAYLTASVSSDRMSADEGGSLLRSFVTDEAFLAQLLGLQVRSAVVMPEATAESVEDATTMGQGSDPYDPAYAALETPAPSPSRVETPVGEALGMLPPAAIGGIAAGLVVLAAGIGGAIFWRRRRQRRAQASAAAKGGKAVEEADGPEKPSATKEAEDNPEKMRV
mmetsp:Transcript_78829/g.218025  ORF Transcript_78829/g.218025 Transcript_78829/m.218025 type:complete len:545 (+) Transcript_78829:66-1700(+)